MRYKLNILRYSVILQILCQESKTLRHNLEIQCHHFEKYFPYFETLSHYFEKVSHYFKILNILRSFVIIFEIQCHYSEKFSQHFKILSHYFDFFSFFSDSGGLASVTFSRAVRQRCLFILLTFSVPPLLYLLSISQLTFSLLQPAPLTAVHNMAGWCLWLESKRNCVISQTALCEWAVGAGSLGTQCAMYCYPVPWLNKNQNFPGSPD